eukprot:CAMPEP_0202501146 /NCGR_PEP_ID=MMETSP1361-20130828/35138_1 /ASSEMBLY_ACC=CAM_ASM_000849 /TAXON_ID=210615 /ORGANISM="Staurosira complex sp., Strain CCMP2646" /LENGTH=143 /DNA_ID=CAMNT_0049133789 /DNA_START=33 /DNA_END=464 /DNA_ORIENTATION=-
MSSASDCQSKYQSALNLYWGVVGASLGLTLLNLVVCRICLRNYLRSNPKVASRIHFGAGGIKILLGILILSAFHPACPSGCTCYGRTPSYAYGVIVLVIGILWCKRGFDWLKVAAESVAGVENANDDDDDKQAVTAVPSSEMV